MRASQADKGLRTISGTQMSYNQKVPVFQVPFCHIDRKLSFAYKFSSLPKVKIIKNAIRVKFFFTQKQGAKVDTLARFGVYIKRECSTI